MRLHIQHTEAVRLNSLRCDFRNRDTDHTGDLGIVPAGPRREAHHEQKPPLRTLIPL